MHLERVKKADPRCATIADRHYSRRKVGSPQFMPPGQTIVLYAPLVLFGWWRPAPSSGIASMNGLDGWTCTIFRNESPQLSSTIILAAELLLVEHADDIGPDGMLTYVYDAKIRSVNPGACFKHAGWHLAGSRPCCAHMRPRSQDRRKTLLHKAADRAGRIE